MMEAPSAPPSLPATGADNSLSLWGLAGMLVLGLILVTSGLLLRRGVAAVHVRR